MRVPTLRRQAAAGTSAIIVAAAAFLSLSSGTDAAWTDDEYVGTAAGVMIAGNCSTTPLFRTESAARQLSGLLGADELDSLAALQGLSVENARGTVSVTPASAIQINPVTFSAPLEASALGSPLLSATLGLDAAAGEAGAYNQWGRATGSGQAAAAAGTVNDQSGAIDATGTADGSATMPRSASINLSSLVPASAADMTLDIGAVASSAEVDACLLVNGWPTPNPVPVENRTYGIAGADLKAGVPSVQSMAAATTSAIDDAVDDLAALDDPGGQVTTTINTGIRALVQGAAGSLTLGTVDTVITIGTLDLSGVQPLLTGTISDGVVTIDLSNSSATVNLAALRGGANGFNGLPPNTVIGIDQALLQEVSQRTTVLLAEWSSGMALALEQALEAATFTMQTQVVLRADVPLLGTVDVARLSIGYATTLGAFLDGSAPQPTITTEVLSGALSGLDTLLTPILTALNNGTGTVVEGVLVPALQGTSGVIPTAVTGIEGAADGVTEELDAILDPLAGVLSLTINVQPDQPGAPVTSAAAGNSAPGEYKISALRIATLGNAAEIYLATASAGPVIFRPEPAP
ncbi:choice-of-anchor G family protein [Arthrobacter sp. B6]|uniref:choice-of-anchor G family protein n=1 Tax=Arthrobacter sp. B6 TaxID=1570137 RepID=UPI000836D3A4|nr:choice-of-anchor G family protein [Arthrobacter sp. B6]